MGDNNYWYAIYTKPRWEKKVALLLEKKEIEFYCPLNKVVKQWSDRKKTVIEPLFKSYVFVKINENKKTDLFSIPGVLNFVCWLGKPAKIKESEIDNIRKFLNEFQSVEVKKADFKVKASIKVKNGIFMNYNGILLQIIDNKAVVKIESMGIKLIATFDKKNLELLPV